MWGGCSVTLRLGDLQTEARISRETPEVAPDATPTPTPVQYATWSDGP
jgi:hypothetical protein